MDVQSSYFKEPSYFKQVAVMTSFVCFVILFFYGFPFLGTEVHCADDDNDKNDAATNYNASDCSPANSILTVLTVVAIAFAIVNANSVWGLATHS